MSFTILDYDKLQPFFQDHMVLKHPSKDTKDLVCEFCGFSTPSQRKLRAHIHDKHEVEKHKQCSLCDYRCPSRWSTFALEDFSRLLNHVA